MTGHHFRPLPLMDMLRDNADTLTVTFLVELLSYLLFAAIVFGAVAWAHRAGVLRFRIRPPVFKGAQIRREIADSSITLVVFQFAQVVFRVAALSFGFAFDFEQPQPLWLQWISLPLILVVHDTYFYWTHRWMHHPRFYRWMHWEHHKSKAPTAWTAYSFAIPEAMVQGSFLVVYAFIFPVTTTTIVFFAFFEIIHNVAIHSGMDVFPRWMVRHRWFGWTAGSIYHDLHHATSSANYGLYFRFWDRLMKTEHPDFEAIYDYVHSPANDGQAYKLIGASRRAARREAVEGPVTEAAAP
jgi:Delta7-sterol 5-desaturase